MTTSVGILVLLIGLIVFQSTPASGQYDDLSVDLFTIYFSSFGLTSDQITQLDSVTQDPTSYATFLLTLDTATAISINNQVIVVNGYLEQIYQAIGNITSVYHNALGKNKKLIKKMDAAVQSHLIMTATISDMPDFPNYQTAAKKLVPAAQWAASYQAAKQIYTNLNSQLPNAAPIITATFGSAFST